jgi:cbb3-type cytochrome oxidase subunit 3
MDVNDLRSAVTVLLFALFAGIVAWVLAPRNKARFDAAQQLPFLDEAPMSRPTPTPTPTRTPTTAPTTRKDTPHE